MIFYFWYRIAAMDQLKQIEAFVNSATRGSLSAAARVEGVTPAVFRENGKEYDYQKRFHKEFRARGRTLSLFAKIQF